ncbi:MAG TPA: hypothetical protein V6C86_13495 [Oculatellaceae cyanobacterium]
MDPLGFAAVVATSVALAAWARNWRRIRVSKSTEYPIEISLVFDRLNSAFTNNALFTSNSAFTNTNPVESSAYKWQLKDTLKDSFITAELLFPAKPKQDGSIRIDLTNLQAEHTLINWTFESKHRVKRTNAGQLETAITAWLESIVTGEIDPATPLELHNKDEEKNQHKALSAVAKLTIKKKTGIVSSEPLEVAKPVQVVYAQLLNAWRTQTGELNTVTIKVTESVDDAYIKTEVKYANPYNPTRFQGNLHIDLSEPAPDSTRIRWHANVSGEGDAARIVKCINEMLIDAMRKAPSAASNTESSARVVHVDFPCDAPKELAYANVYQQITTSTPDFKWTLNECYKGQSIRATVECTMPPSATTQRTTSERTTSETPTLAKTESTGAVAHPSNSVCKANVTIEFRQLAHYTRVDINYLFSQDSDVNIISAFVKFTNERLRAPFK